MRHLLVVLLLLAGCAGPGTFELRPLATSEGEEQVPFLAGVADVPFTPEKGYPLGGYGGGARRDEFPLWFGMGWIGRIALAAHMAWHEEGDVKADLLVPAEGVHDDVSARAVVLRPEGRAPLAICRIDAIGTTAELHGLVAEKLAPLGYAPERVLLVATHTHSGPGSYFRTPFACVVGTDVYRPELEARIADACVAAITSAHASARPAELVLARTRDRGLDGVPLLAKNRRARRFDPGTIHPDDIDDEVGLLLLREREAKTPIALLLNYAVHPTVLGSDNLHFSGDLGHGLEEALEARLGAPALFVNGAEGDIAPRALAAPGGLLRCRELGQAFADMVLPALQGAAAHDRIALRSAWGEQEMGPPWTCVALARERFIAGDDGLPAALTAPLALPVNAILWVAGFTNIRFALTWNFALGLVVDLDGLVPRTRTRMAATRLRAGVEDVALVTFPGEATHEVGLAAKDAARAAGATRVFVLGLGLDHLGYIAGREEYLRGGYEAQSTIFGPGTADLLLAGQARLLEALGYAPTGSPTSARPDEGARPSRK